MLSLGTKKMKDFLEVNPMPLTRKEKQRIYEEELERIKARERIEAERKRKSYSFKPMDLIIVMGFLLMGYILLFER